MATDTHVRVTYADTDAMGFAYYGNYMKWFEVGRAEWFRSTGTAYRDLEQNGIFLPVVEAHCSYLKPAFYDDLLTVRTAFSFTGRARLRFDYEILRSDELLTTGYTLHVCMNSERKAQKPPDFLRRLLESGQNS
ncbi:MAG: thioesterase family protein [Syntrophobacteraceae bacterium]